MWHPATDDAKGTESYNIGKATPDPEGTDNTFSLRYAGLAWDQIMFSTGKLMSGRWMVFDRTALEHFVDHSRADFEDCVRCSS